MRLYDWDTEKARINFEKHGVSFEEARTVLEDPLARYHADQNHSDEEERFFVLGHSVNHRILVVIHSERGHTVRIISARLANRRERESYEQERT